MPGADDGDVVRSDNAIFSVDASGSQNMPS
jgi:hypothetical protein